MKKKKDLPVRGSKRTGGQPTESTIVPCPLAAAKGSRTKAHRQYTKPVRGRNDSKTSETRHVRRRNWLTPAQIKSSAPAMRPPETCGRTQSAAVAVATAPIPDLLLDGEFTGGGQKQAQSIGKQRKKHRPRDAVKKRAIACTTCGVSVRSVCLVSNDRRR